MTKPKFKFQLAEMAVLASKMQKASDLSNKHAEAVQEAVAAFREAFGEDVPDENFGMTASNNREIVGHLFNDFVTHGENYGGDNIGDLVETMIRLMSENEGEV